MRAAHAGQRIIERSAGQQMSEAIDTFGLFQDMTAETGIQEVEQLLIGQIDCIPQHVEAELTPDHSSGC